LHALIIDDNDDDYSARGPPAQRALFSIILGIIGEKKSK
jgi:hypothetical protein